MHDPHLLAIIPLQKDLLLSETSSNSSSGSIPNSNDGSSPGPDAPLVPIRALVPHKGAAAGRDETLRSEDETALMRSLISLLPHEQADSQVFASTFLGCCKVQPGCSCPCRPYR